MKRNIGLSFIVFLALLTVIVSCTGSGGGNDPAPSPITSTPPTVSSTIPSNGATNIAPNAAITVTFSEDVQAGTVNTSTVTVNGVAGTVNLNGSTATLTPNSPLAYNTTYTGKVTAGVKDLAGEAMAADYTWSFTTGQNPDTTPPTISSTSPANVATGVAVNAAITATFSESMLAGTISTATFTVTGVAGTVSLNGNTATFTPSTALAYSTTYTAKVTTGVKDLAGNSMAADYTWSFTTGSAPDTTSPTISSTSPANVATGVAVNAAITATFSESMLAGTISTATFTVTGVAGTVSLNGTTATFTPSSDLAYSMTYTATITTGVKDLAGNSMAADYTWSFTTGSAPDTTPPTISSISPTNGATGVATNAAITATFSETMLAGTISTATFTVTGVAGTVGLNGTTATFTPSSDLAYSMTYTATITTGVKDLAGNSMAADYTWSFTTQADPNPGPTPWTLPLTNSGTKAIVNKVDSAGNRIVVGITDGSFSGFTSQGGNDIFVVKYDPSGVETWHKQFGTQYDDTMASWSLAVSPNGDISVLWVDGQSTQYVYSFNVNGNEIKTFISPAGPNGIAADNSTVYVSTGYGTIVKVDKATGSISWTWQAQFGGQTSLTNIVISDNYVIAMGDTDGAVSGFTNFGMNDAILVILDVQKNFIWAKQVGTADMDTGLGLAVDSSGIYVGIRASVGGFNQGYYRLLKYGYNGNDIWSKDYTQFAGSPWTMVSDETSVYAAGDAGLVKMSTTDGTIQKSVSGYKRSVDINGNDLYVTDDSNNITPYNKDTLEQY